MLQLIKAGGRPIVCYLLLVTYWPTVTVTTQACNAQQICTKTVERFFLRADHCIGSDRVTNKYKHNTRYEKL